MIEDDEMMNGHSRHPNSLPKRNNRFEHVFNCSKPINIESKNAVQRKGELTVKEIQDSRNAISFKPML